MKSLSDLPLYIDQMYEYSKSLDENRDELEDLPFPSAYSLMTGSDIPVMERDGDERALWQLLDEGEKLTDNQIDLAKRVVTKYPPVDELEEMYEKQSLYASLFDIGIRFDTYDVRYAKDLLSKINGGRLISNKQFKYVKYFIYRYRDQLEEQIVYEEKMSERLEENLGEDIRESFHQIVQDSKPAYEEIDTRYDAQN